MSDLDARIDRLIARLQREQRTLQALLRGGQSLEEAEQVLAPPVRRAGRRSARPPAEEGEGYRR